MMEKETILNKVAQSGIVSIDLEELIPARLVNSIDIETQLFQGLILREKDFRAWIKEYDWTGYKNTDVAVHCSADAVVPTWAYMLVAAALQGAEANVFFCAPSELNAIVVERALSGINPQDYAEKRVVIKGCGERAISNHAYVLLTAKLVPVVKSLMYGEPCSTVPVYKQRK
jgi:hypothetical protein